MKEQCNDNQDSGHCSDSADVDESRRSSIKKIGKAAYVAPTLVVLTLTSKLGHTFSPPPPPGAQNQTEEGEEERPPTF